MSNLDKYPEKTVLVWTCSWMIVVVALRLLKWRVHTWMPGSWTGHYPIWLLMLRFVAELAALSSGILWRLRRR